MATFPGTVERVIQDFAGSLGLPARPANDGTYSFRFGAGDILTFTPTADSRSVLISFAFKPDRPGDQVEERALKSAGYDPTQDRFTHVGMASDGTVVIAQSLPGESFDLPTIDAGLLYLRALRGNIG